MYTVYIRMIVYIHSFWKHARVRFGECLQYTIASMMINSWQTLGVGHTILLLYLGSFAMGCSFIIMKYSCMSVPTFAYIVRTRENVSGSICLRWYADFMTTRQMYIWNVSSIQHLLHILCIVYNNTIILASYDVEHAHL